MHIAHNLAIIRISNCPHAGENNYYIDSEHCSLQKAVSDAGPYALTLGSNSSCADVTDCHFEGAIVASIRILGGQGHRILNNLLTDQPVAIVDGSPGNAPIRVQIIGNRITGGMPGLSPGSVGIDLSNPTSYDFVINSNNIVGFQTAIKCYNWGYDIMTGNFIRGIDIGLDMYPTSDSNMSIIVSSNVISGDSYSVKHSRGNKVMYIGNYTENGAGASSPINVLSGNPIIIPEP